MPTLTPFFFHWYAGVVPPLVGTAVNVTFVPEQTLVALGVMLTLGVTFGLTVIVVLVLVATAGLAHVNDEVITTDITSVLVNVLSLYVVALVPTFTDPFFH